MKEFLKSEKIRHMFSRTLGSKTFVSIKQRFKRKGKLEKILDNAEISEELKEAIIPVLKKNRKLKKNIKKIIRKTGIGVLGGLKLFFKKSNKEEEDFEDYCKISLKEVLKEYENENL